MWLLGESLENKSQGCISPRNDEKNNTFDLLSSLFFFRTINLFIFCIVISLKIIIPVIKKKKLNSIKLL